MGRVQQTREERARHAADAHERDQGAVRRDELRGNRNDVQARQQGQEQPQQAKTAGPIMPRPPQQPHRKAQSRIPARPPATARAVSARQTARFGPTAPAPPSPTGRAWIGASGSRWETGTRTRSTSTSALSSRYEAPRSTPRPQKTTDAPHAGPHPPPAWFARPDAPSTDTRR